MALNYTRLGGSGANFQQMIQRFGIVTVMNATVYEPFENEEIKNLQADAIIKKYSEDGVELCKLDTLKIANVTEEGPTKTVTGGQYNNPLIKFGKTARLEMQDALGSAAALDALCGGVAEVDALDNGKIDYSTVFALHFGSDFSGPKCIIGDSFFIDQKSGQQVKVKIIFYQFLPDSLFNLTQDAEGDATVFDMNGDLLATDITVKDINSEDKKYGVFYSIVDAEAKPIDWLNNDYYTLEQQSTDSDANGNTVTVYTVHFTKNTRSVFLDGQEIAPYDTESPTPVARVQDPDTSEDLASGKLIIKDINDKKIKIIVPLIFA